MSEKPDCIDRDFAHERAKELVPEEFFWDCSDELAPFGSDEGDTALAEYRNWRKENDDRPLMDCVRWTVESVGQMNFEDYNERLLSPEKVRSQVEDEGYDDYQYIFTLDISVLATVFGQLVDEGKIDPDVKPVASLAIARQKLWTTAHDDDFSDEYIGNLAVLERVLKIA